MRTTAAPLVISPRRLFVAALLLGLAAAAPASAIPSSTDSEPPRLRWKLLDSGSNGHLVGLDAVSHDVAWVGSSSGRGEVLLTVDGGATFTDVAPPHRPGGVKFPGVEASSATVAVVLALAGRSTRIYRTADGGETWTKTFQSEPPYSFYCMAMFDRRNGFVVGTAVDDKFQVIVTTDGGRSWELVDDAGMPPVVAQESLLSPRCATATGRNAFFGSIESKYAGTGDRVFRSADFGQTWEVSTTTGSGSIDSLNFRTNRLGLINGGFRTTDGGVTWEPFEGVNANDMAWWSDVRGDERVLVPDAQKTVFAVRPVDSLASYDRGKTWAQFDDVGFDVIECVEDSLACWASGNWRTGDYGQIAKLVVGSP